MGFAIFENLTKCNADLYREVKTMAGYKNVWTRVGSIMMFNKDSKVFRVNSKREIGNVRHFTQSPDDRHLWGIFIVKVIIFDWRGEALYVIDGGTKWRQQTLLTNFCQQQARLKLA